jgi:hypothetical protein
LTVKEAGAAKAYLNEWMASPSIWKWSKQAPLKLPKITERRHWFIPAQASYMHRDKGNTAADSRNWRQYSSIPKRCRY